MSGVQNAANDVDLDLGRLLSSLAAKWLRILTVCLVITGLALVLARVATPRYMGETRLLIETRESVFTRPDIINPENYSLILDEEGVTSQVEVIGSTDILKQVAQKLDLSRLPEFDEAVDMSPFGRVLVMAGLKTDPNKIPPEERVLKAFREKLTVYRVEKSRVIVIEFWSEDPKLAAEIPNALADTYLAVQRDAKSQSNSDATEWKSESVRASEEEVELRALERETAAQRELLESYLTRYREAASRRGRNYLPVDARIFSRAIVPAEPYFPKTIPIVGAAFAASLLIVAIVTLLRELFSGRAMRPAPSARPQPIEQVLMPEGAGESVYAQKVDQVREPNSRSTERPGKEASKVSSLGEVTVETAAEKLISGGAARAIFISPEGDEAAAAAVMVAREVADSGLRVLLLDLTANGAASRPMLESSAYAEITNLLASEAQFSDVIHADLYSDCHVIPLGTADPERAMRAADRLPIIMNSLTTAYDVVVVECGPADAEGIRRLVSEGTEILVSVLEPTDEAIAETAADLAAGGYGELTLVSPAGYEPPVSPLPDRSAA